MNWSELQHEYELAQELRGEKKEKDQEARTTLADMARTQLLAAAKKFLSEQAEIQTETVIERFLANIFFLIRIHEECPSLRDFLFKNSKEFRFGRLLTSEYWDSVVLSQKGVFFSGSSRSGGEEFREFSTELTIDLWENTKTKGAPLIRYFAKLTPSKILEKIWKSLEEKAPD